MQTFDGEFYENFENMYIEQKVWLSASGYKFIYCVSQVQNIFNLSFGPSNFSLRHDVYHRFQCTIEHRHVSVYICMERNNSQDLFADQYIPIVLLEMTSWLPVYRPPPLPSHQCAFFLILFELFKLNKLFHDFLKEQMHPECWAY